MVSQDDLLGEFAGYSADDVVDGCQEKLNFVDKIYCWACVRIFNAVLDAT